MTVESILTEFNRLGIAFRAEGDKLIAKPLNAVPAELRQAVHKHRSALLAHLRADAVECRTARICSLTLNSRHPLIPPEVRQKIEAIESDARAKGWPAELLWNAGFWDSPRGLAAVLDPEDQIGEVTQETIEILKTMPRRLNSGVTFPSGKWRAVAGFCTGINYADCT